MNNITTKYIYLLIFITPYIDILNGIQVIIFKSNSNVTFGNVIRIFLLFFMILLYFNKRSKNLLLKMFGLLFLIIQQIIFMFFYDINLKNIFLEINFLMKIMYTIILLLIIIENFHLLDVDRLLELVIFSTSCISIVIILSRILNIGAYTYQSVGYKGLFLEQNAVTAILVSSIPFIIDKIYKVEKNYKYLYCFFQVFIACFLLGTKTAVSGAILVTGMYLFFFRVEKKFEFKKIIFLSISISIMLFIYKFIWGYFKNTIVLRWNYFFSNLDFISFILSSRNKTLVESYKFFSNNILLFFSGNGYINGFNNINSFLTGHAVIEMDIFDIIYFYGVIAGLIILVLLLKPIYTYFLNLKNKCKINKTYMISYLSILFISFFGGHVLLTPMAGTFFAVIYGINYGISKKK